MYFLFHIYFFWCVFLNTEKSLHAEPTWCLISLFQFCEVWSPWPGLFLTHRSSMLLSHWLPGHRAKLLRITWTSSRTNGKSKFECWLRLWMTSHQWMTSSLFQVINTKMTFIRQLEEGNKVRKISQACHGPVFHAALQVFSRLCKCIVTHFENPFLLETGFQNTKWRHGRGKHNLLNRLLKEA